MKFLFWSRMIFLKCFIENSHSEMKDFLQEEKKKKGVGVEGDGGRKHVNLFQYQIQSNCK